ncbi:MAG: type II toxin-antitoxin system PemK/MazF family toxin [Cyanobium sp.]
MAERGRLYRWPRNRASGDSKSRPVLVLAPDAATRHGRRWVVLPLSTEPGLAANPLAYRLDPTEVNGLSGTSFVMAWLPTTVLAESLQGPVGRLEAAQVAAIAGLVIEALDLRCLEPWQET